ncbi:MAG: hypothetical protein SLRJCFUN_000535 [Candidatus Fervidibacter sp.]
MAWGIAFLAFLLPFVGAQERDLQTRQAIKAQGSGLTVSWQFEAVKINGQGAELRAAGVPLLRLRGEGAEASVQRIAAQLNDARWRGVSPEALQVVWVRGGYQLQLQGEPLLTVTHALAQQMGSEPKALAQQWAQRLRQALSWQWLAVPLTEAVIAVGEELTIPLLGNAVGDVQVQARPAEPVRWQVVVEKQAVFVALKGVDVGAGILRIVKGKVGVRLPFRVLHRAARWRQTPVAWVRGKQVSKAMVWEAVENAVLMAMQFQLGARWQVLPAPDGQLPSFVKPNEALVWRVQVTGEQLLPVDEVVTIPLRSFPSSLGDADLLVISNDPETFRDYRVLCRGLLPIGQTVRFMVHHRNGLTQPAALSLELLNTEERPVSIITRFGYGTPKESELQVGHEATASFLQGLNDDAAVRLTLPSQSAYRLLRFALKPKDTASALVEVRLDEPAGIAYRVITTATMPPKTELLTGTQLAEALTGGNEPPPFPKPMRILESTHVAGGAWTFLSVGRFGLQHPLKGRTLHGNYGVVYRVTLRFVNPTARLWRAQLLVEPTGGVAKGAFLVNGRLVEVPLLRPYQEHLLHAFSLAPNQTQTVTVVTIPSAGSFYPIQLVARTQ